ncbi:MAG: hypothetical protein FWH06_04545 [Oscillospiraceae bacterium]|nr:hypothetical protein [Oscillospiraceae bacterium]
MKKSILSKLKSNKGESLMEILVSFFLLTTLLLALMVIIRSAKDITKITIENANETQQEAINPVVLLDYDDIAATNIKAGRITFQLSIDIDGAAPEETEVEHFIDIIDVDGIISFNPN